MAEQNTDKEYAIKLAQCFGNRRTFVACGVETWCSSEMKLLQQRYIESNQLSQAIWFHKRSERVALAVVMRKEFDEFKLIKNVFGIVCGKQIDAFITIMVKLWENFAKVLEKTTETYHKRLEEIYLLRLSELSYDAHTERTRLMTGFYDIRRTMYESEMIHGYDEVGGAYDSSFVMSTENDITTETRKFDEVVYQSYFNEEQQRFGEILQSTGVSPCFYTNCRINCSVINRKFVKNVGGLLSHMNALLMSEIDNRSKMYTRILNDISSTNEKLLMKLA